MPGQTQVRPEAKQFLDQVIPLLIIRLVEEDEKEVCADACEALADALNLFGLGAYGDKTEYVYRGCLAIMK